MTPDSQVNRNRSAWEAASEKYVHEYQDHLDRARNECSLFARELDLLRPILAHSPAVVHLQSGHGLDDIALVDTGARSVVAVDFSQVAATAAQRRADELGAPCRYVVAQLPGAPLRDACADLVYTGKGALIWLPDLGAWAADVARLLRPGGHLFVYEAHPAVPLWTWDEDEPRIRPDRGYFERSHVNDTFPAHGAVEFQTTLAEVINAVLSAGLELQYVAEYPEPFWYPADGHAAAAWAGRLPNTYALIARRRHLGPDADAKLGGSTSRWLRFEGQAGLCEEAVEDRGTGLEELEPGADQRLQPVDRDCSEAGQAALEV